MKEGHTWRRPRARVAPGGPGIRGGRRWGGGVTTHAHPCGVGGSDGFMGFMGFIGRGRARAGSCEAAGRRHRHRGCGRHRKPRVRGREGKGAAGTAPGKEVGGTPEAQPPPFTALLPQGPRGPRYREARSLPGGHGLPPASRHRDLASCPAWHRDRAGTRLPLLLAVGLLGGTGSPKPPPGCPGSGGGGHSWGRGTPVPSPRAVPSPGASP